MACILPFPSPSEPRGDIATSALSAGSPASIATSPDSANEAADALPSTFGRRCEYALGDMARMLGMGEYSTRTIIRYLRAMAGSDGLPLPKTPRLRGAVLLHGPAAIHRHSRWDAERVDGWLAGRDGHDPAPPASAGLRAQLANRAENLAQNHGQPHHTLQIAGA